MRHKFYKHATPPLDRRSRDLRKTIIKTLAAAGRCHVGSAFSLVEILRVLYDDILRYDPKNPHWEERDRLVLSKGHGCLAIYALLAEKGFFPESELWKACKSDGILGGHPEYGKVPGIEASTGSLGHGLPIAVGMALAARAAKSARKVIAVIGDGESNEGSIWEAALSAGKHKLSNLTVVIDYNKHQSCGSTFEIQDLEPFDEKWKAFGFAVQTVDGHDVEALRKAFQSLPFSSERPSALICDTIKGKGAAHAENNMSWHHKVKVTEEEIAALLAAVEA